MQLFEKRLITANASGWSLVWGDSFTKVLFVVNEHGGGPAWGRSLFEDKMLVKPHSPLTCSIFSVDGHGYFAQSVIKFPDMT
jgi:hypothetical protein